MGIYRWSRQCNFKNGRCYLLGMAIDKNVQIASKSVVKANPHERVGVFCKMNGHPKVIEY